MHLPFANTQYLPEGQETEIYIPSTRNLRAIVVGCDNAWQLSQFVARERENEFENRFP